jgi:hypothetical protein
MLSFEFLGVLVGPILDRIIRVSLPSDPHDVCSWGIVIFTRNTSVLMFLAAVCVSHKM